MIINKRRVPVIAGTGANSTDETIEITKHAKKSDREIRMRVWERGSGGRTARDNRIGSLGNMPID